MITAIKVNVLTLKILNLYGLHKLIEPLSDTIRCGIERGETFPFCGALAFFTMEEIILSLIIEGYFSLPFQ